MISYDRPGYGNSDFGNPLTSISSQADYILPIINKNKHQLKPILIGHSFGATVAAEIAMNYPDKIGGVILVGAAVDPKHERIFWISYLADLCIFKWLVPKSILVANAEKLTHVDELNKMIQTTNKKLVIYDNIGHLIPWTNPDLMKKEIFEMTKNE
jgi:pimeloyl-ACP methyl ester carboxylesterase